MRPTVAEFLLAAGCPSTMPIGEFGRWRIFRQDIGDVGVRYFGGPRIMTTLGTMTEATLHTAHDEIVMEDSYRELRKHLPIWLAARGRILITGLGLGCVVRGLLASPDVERIDVVEIDGDILNAVGPEFAHDPRVVLHHGDALTIELDPALAWDFAWHDIWTPGNAGLELLHAQLIKRFVDRVGRQGAWAFPAKHMQRLTGHALLGGGRLRRAA